MPVQVAVRFDAWKASMHALGLHVVRASECPALTSYGLQVCRANFRSRIVGGVEFVAVAPDMVGKTA